MTASEANKGRDFEVGEWTAFPDRNVIERSSRIVHLEPRVMDLLVYLAERPDEVLSVEQIINDVWPHSFVTDGALMTAISVLRKALGDDPRRPAYIETIPKRGYRLVASSSARIAVLAVLPIRNESGDPDRSFLAEGLFAGLIDSLGTIPALRVISRSSAMSSSRANRSVGEIARNLGARLVLSGAMSGDPGRLVVAIRLDDVTDGRTMLDETFSRPESELLELEREIVQAVAAATADRLRSKPAAPPTDADPNAVIEFLRGRYHYYRQSPEHFDKALEHFERATRIDPTYAPAHVGIADVWGAYGYWGAKDARGVRDHVLTHSRKAVEIDPENPDALVIRATTRMYLDHDWATAEADLQRAVALNPNLCHTRLINALLLGTLRRPQALDEINRALRIDPLNPAVLLVRGLIHSSRGDDAAALADVDEVLAIDPGHPPGLQLRAELHWRSANPDAIELERRVWQADEPVLAAWNGNPDGQRALRRAAEILTARSRETYVAPYEIARLLALGDRLEAALDRIEQALDAGDLMRIDFLQLSPAFAAVREQSRYRQLAAKLGIPA